VDEGGVAKEYFRLLSAELFAPEFGMFKHDTESRYLWFDPGSNNAPDDFWMAGAIVGLAVYNNVPGLDVNFPPALFKALKDKPMTRGDLRQVFPAHAASLQAVLDWSPQLGVSAAEAEEQFEDIFCLDFSVSFEARGKTKTANLHGIDEAPPPVTLSRRMEFADLFQAWYLSKGIESQIASFKSGFSHVCDSPVFNCLSAPELEAIVCGEKDLNFAHLREGAKVVDTGAKFSEGYLDLLWEVLDDLDKSQKRLFLKFITGSDLAPLGGLAQLGLKIQRNGSEPTHQLPTAHTCFNLLALPEYDSRDKLRRLLVTAIENAEGFGLE